MPDAAFIERSRYFLAEEYPTKLRLAVGSLPDDVVWRKANAESNSIGNLLLHLSGNIRQWIVTGVGGEPGERDRAAEFSADHGQGGAELLSRLDATVRDADRVLSCLVETDLERRITIQGRDTTVLGAVYHVVEHFAMHTGQILLLAKMYSPGSFKFYEDAGGIAIPLWGGNERVRRTD